MAGEAAGNMIVVRYADDIVAGFEDMKPMPAAFGKQCVGGLRSSHCRYTPRGEV